MVGKKISELPVIPSSPALTDVFAEVQPPLDGVTYKCTFQQLLDLYLANLGIILPANGGTGVASPTAHTLPVAEGTSAFNFLGPLTNGQVLIGSTGVDPVPATLTAGAGIIITNGAGTISIAAGSPTGLVKFSSASTGAYVATTGSISVDDDTIPQNNQGTQVLTITHTPLNAANTLEIEVNLQVAGQNNEVAQSSAGLFQDAIVPAIAAAGCDDGDTGSRIVPLAFKKIMTAGTTSPITFNVRLGSSTGGNLYLNGILGHRTYGGVSASTITVKEYGV